MLKSPAERRAYAPAAFSGLAEILRRLRNDDDQALHELYEYSHEHLHRVATRVLGEQDRTPTLGATALVNESFLKMFPGAEVRCIEDPRHFFNLAALCMKQAMLTYRRDQQTLARGKGFRRSHQVELLLDGFERSPHRFEDLCEAIDTLDAESPRTAEVVKLKYFSRMTNGEIAELVDRSEGTVVRILATGKARLRLLLS